MFNREMKKLTLALICIGVMSGCGSKKEEEKSRVKDLTMAFSEDRVPSKVESSVYVEPITLTEIQEASNFDLNIGLIVANEDIAKGAQKAADVYGLKLDLFISKNLNEREKLAKRLILQNESFIAVDTMPSEDLSPLVTLSESHTTPMRIVGESTGNSEKDYDLGFSLVRGARANLLDDIPKYDQLLPLAFPVTPLPDNFFQPSKFPYPNPLVRAARTNESVSASVHAHTSCNMVAQTGNMLHRTSSIDPNRLLMGMEGGNLSLQAIDDAISTEKLSAVMTSWVLSLGGGNGDQRKILVENNGVDSSLFTPAIHAPEELDLALREWKSKGKIGAFEFLDHEHLRIIDFEGQDRTFRAGLFLVANDRNIDDPSIIAGNDAYGAKTLDFYSTQEFVQQLVEIGGQDFSAKPSHIPSGGILTRGGTTTSSLFGKPLSDWLREVPQTSSPVQPYVMYIEGGYFIVTPKTPLDRSDLLSQVSSVYIDLRGPLTSDQTITFITSKRKEIVFRRTALNFDQTARALKDLKSMGLISGWDFDGARGRGIFANIILYDFMGKNRKFMSSLAVWPTDEKPERPITRFYVDGMQRLNFTSMTIDGWRQEFVEVPMRIPPVPRDIALYSGQSELEKYYD